MAFAACVFDPKVAQAETTASGDGRDLPGNRSTALAALENPAYTTLSRFDDALHNVARNASSEVKSTDEDKLVDHWVGVTVHNFSNTNHEWQIDVNGDGLFDVSVPQSGHRYLRDILGPGGIYAAPEDVGMSIIFSRIVENMFGVGAATRTFMPALAIRP